MRILVQQNNNGLYLQDSGAWTHRSKEARNFLSSAEAIEHCLSNKYQHVQLVLKFEDHLFDLVLPIAVPADSSSTAPTKTAQL